MNLNDANHAWAIEVEDLTVAYADQPVLWDIDLQVPTGVKMAIIGPNGAGKSTLVKAAMGLVKPSGSSGAPVTALKGRSLMCRSGPRCRGISRPM
jgi:manganese/zinc/iron transport system ATP- binding protein